MNKLLIHLPEDEGTKPIVQLKKILRFIDCERFEAYWDEKSFRSITAKEETDPSDKTSLGLRRMAFTGLTDFRHMPPPEPGHMIYLADDDMTDSLWGRYAKAVSSKENIALVIPSDIFAPPVLAVWRDNAQLPPLRINECLRKETDAHDWFSHHRDPARMFNHQSDKHRKKEYITGEGVRVSPLDLDKTDIEHNLKIAVGDKKERRLFGYHKGRGSVIIFSLENHPKDGETPVYHGHRLQNDDPHQIHRLPPSPIKKLELYHSVKLL